MAGTEKNCLLIVDDVEMNRAILSSIFEDEYKIIEAENGQEALKRLEQNDGQIAAVLLDVVMPVMNGFEMLQYMKENNIGQDIPVFLITADASEKNMYEGYSLGVKDIIEKPFIPYFLKQRIRSVVDLYCTKEQLRETVEHQAEIIEEKVKEVNALSRNVIETLALAIEFRSGETGQHIQNIYQLTRILLRALRETAVSASVPSHDTYILSTILYRDCTSIDSIIGRDMLNSSESTGFSPILLFCFSIVSSFLTHLLRHQGRFGSLLPNFAP